MLNNQSQPLEDFKSNSTFEMGNCKRTDYLKLSDDGKTKYEVALEQL